MVQYSQETLGQAKIKKKKKAMQLVFLDLLIGTPSVPKLN